jgi:hypothetical protein
MRDASRPDAEAVERIVVAGDARDAMGHASVWPWMLRLSPFAASLRGTPRWNAWLRTLNAPASANP